MRVPGKCSCWILPLPIHNRLCPALFTMQASVPSGDDTPRAELLVDSIGAAAE